MYNYLERCESHAYHSYLPKATEPIIMKGARHDSSNKMGKARLPIIAPILPIIMVRLTAMVLKTKKRGYYEIKMNKFLNFFFDRNIDRY